MKKNPFLLLAVLMVIPAITIILTVIVYYPDREVVASIPQPEAKPEPPPPPKMTVEEKKARFKKLVLPAVKNVYQELREQYLEVADTLAEGGDVSRFSRLQDIYEADSAQQLLRALKPHPISIALAQAAMESSWGTSRFFKKANNLFGVWSFDENEPRLAAGQKRGDETIWVKKYPSIEASVRDYYRILARGRAYNEFRRLKMRTDDPFQLVTHLDSYSEKGKVYGEQLAAIIEHNDFDSYDQPLTSVVTAPGGAVEHPEDSGALPEIPEPAPEDIEAQAEIGDGMSENTVRDTAGSVEQQAVSDTGHDTGEDQVMLHTEEQRPDDERGQAVGADTDTQEVGVDDIAQQEGTPEQLLHEGHDEHRPEQAQSNETVTN